MSGKKILYFDKAPGPYRDILEQNTPAGFEMWYWDEMNLQDRQEKLAEADYFLVVSHQVDATMIAQAKKLRHIQRTGAGVNNIDVDAATRLQIPVANLPGGNSIAVAELTILLILALYRKLPIANQATKAGRWPNWEFRTASFEMDGKTHGFIGFGNIGRETAKRSKAFGTRIVYHDKYRVPEQIEKELGATWLPFEEVLKQADILSIHVPLIPETKGMIGINELKLMKRNALIINVARGGIVKEDDLFQALKEGIIAGAGIDTWESEPVQPDNPLLRLDNVIATPHFAAGTIDTFNKVVRLAIENIQRAEDSNRPHYVVNGVEMARTV